MIETYHAHVYFELAQSALAEQVRKQLMLAIPEHTYSGKLVLKLVGPHPKPMFEIHIPANVLDQTINTIETLREGLDVLIHPVNGDPVAAHTTEAKWLGKPLALNITLLKQLIEQQKSRH